MARGVTTDLDTFQIFKLVDRFLRGMEDGRPVGMEVHYLHVIHLFRFEFLVVFIRHFGGHKSALESQRQVDDFRKRKPAP